METMSAPSCPRCGASCQGQPLEECCPACLLEGVLAGSAWTGPEPEEEPAAALPRCGSYELLEMIGRGASGVVYRARQPGLNRAVAIKLLAQTAGPEEWRRFRTEAEAVSSLEHPHIIPVHATGETDGRPWLVMKLAEQGSLSDRLHPNRALPAGEAARLVEQAARAVQFAHERGVLHRDLKPANILLDGNGSPMISDFGLARLLHGAGAGTLTGFAVGTPAYMPPEQAGGGTVTTGSDVYSLGAVLYHTLTGRAPFSGPMPLAVMRDVMTVEPVAPRQWQPDLDRDLTVICRKAMEKDPARRYRSAGALADDLARWRNGEAILARPAGWRERSWKWARRHPAKASGLLLGGIGAVAFVTLLSVAQVLLTKERNEVKRQEAEARSQAARAEATGEALRLQAYAGDLALARRALDEGNLGAARRLLAVWQPSPGTPDVRGFEWHALHRECQGSERRALRHHEGPVLALAWSPDGTQLVSGGRDGRLIVWDPTDGRVRRSLPEPATMPPLTELAWLATLPLLARETTALLASGTLPPAEAVMRARLSHLGEITSLAWSPDGRHVVSGGIGCFVRIWNAADWTLQGFLPVKGVKQAGFSVDGKRLILAAGVGNEAGSPAEVRVYEFPSLERLRSLPASGAFFAGPDQAGRMAVAADGGRIRLMDSASGRTTHEWKSGLPVPSALALTPDGHRLAAVHPSGVFTARAEDGAEMIPLPGASPGSRTITVSPDAALFATGGTDQAVSLMKFGGRLPIAIMRGHEDEVRAVAFSPDGTLLASAGNDHTVRLWDRTGSARPILNTVEETAVLTIAMPDSDWLLGDHRDGTVVRRNWRTGAVYRTPPGVVRKALGFGGVSGAFVTLQPTAALVEWWDESGRIQSPALTLEVPRGDVKAFAACPARGWLITGGDRHPVVVWDWHTGVEIQRFKPPDPVSRLVISPDGNVLGALTWPRTLQVMNPADGLWREPWRLGTGTVGPIRFSPDSRLLASGGDDNLVTVRLAATGGIVASLKSHLGEMMALAFSQDGRTLASSSKDRTVRLWHVPTWRELGAVRRGTLDSGLGFTDQGLVVEQYQDRWILRPGAE